MSDAATVATNPGCAARCGACPECLSPLPFGASCASSCVHVARCKALFGQRGSEGACQWVPSRFTPNPHAQGDATIGNPRGVNAGWTP